MKHGIKPTIATGLTLLLTLMLGGCSKSKTAPDNFNVPLYAPDYASGFDIKGADGSQSVMLTVRNPWQGADSVTTRLFIARNGEEAPDGFDGQVIKNDARRIVAMSSTHIAMLDAIGEVGRIVGGSALDYISNPYIQAHRDKIGDVGYEGNVNYELLMSLRPGIVLLYGVNGANPMERKLCELGVPYLYVGDYLEESPLGKAEWLVALAEVTGNRRKGVETFAGIPARYNALKQLVAEKASGTPKVMLNAPYGSSWFMPPAESYFVRLLTDAGGDYLYKANTGNSSRPIDMEEAYMLTSQADVWLNAGNATALNELKATCPRMAATGCVANGMVFNNTRRMNDAGGNDFYESAIVNPDILLRDLVRIFHPDLVQNELVYYKQLK